MSLETNKETVIAGKLEVFDEGVTIDWRIIVKAIKLLIDKGIISKADLGE